MDSLKIFLKNKNIDFSENTCAKNLCSFRVGGEAECVARPKSHGELTDLLCFLKAEKLGYIILGKGSNVIFPDGRFCDLVILTCEMNEITVSENSITAQAGASLYSLAVAAEKNSLCGLEFAHGIPGSVGGAVYMNAGAYGGEIKDALVSCLAYDADENEIIELSLSDCGFSYRKSVFNNRKSLVILSATFALSKGDPNEIREKMNDFKVRRKEKQPLEYPSAGSSFKRPEGYFAGKLIEDAGLKGAGFGGACVSEKHAGFIINKGDATCSDIKKTVELVKNKVKEQFGVALECEFEFIGEGRK